MDLRQIFKVWKEVFFNWRYFLLAVFIALFFYSFNVLILGLKSLVGFYNTAGFFKMLNLFFVMFLGFKDILTTISFVSLVLISILLGKLFSMLIYKSNALYSGGKSLGVFGSIGAFLAVFAPGCAACGIGVASAIGLGAGVLSFLPYDGLELSAVAIIILVITIFKTTKNMYVCMVPNIGKNVKTNLKGGKKK